MKKWIAALLVFLLCAGVFFPDGLPASAASNNVFNPVFSYDQQTGKWNIDWVPIDGADTVHIQWHDPNTVNPENTRDFALTGTTTDGKSRISLEFTPDHIYDLTFSFKNSSGDTINFRNKYNQQVASEPVFFLPGITFEGTSFNDMAILGGLRDANPTEIKSADESQVIRIISGEKPQITLRWKVPTIWQPSSSDPSAGQFLYITHKDVDLNRLESSASPHVDIDFSYFHIKMNEVQDTITPKDYRTGYNSAGQIIIRETGKEVSGFDSNGAVKNETDGYVTYTLDRTDDIKSGTEYEKINIRLYFWNETENEQAISSRLVYGSGAGQGFPLENKDNIFQTIEGRIDSLFTPMKFEVSKVDVDKMLIRIYKIKSKNYSELYYQVQSAGTIVELMENATKASTGVKVPDASIPGSTGWGSVIVEIPLDQYGQHPEYYYRIVVTDGNAHTPIGSLAIDLRMLGNDTGKPPVPREIEVQALYAEKRDVTYTNNNPEGETAKIPTTNLRISFEKPLLWMTRPWEEIKAAPDDDNDFTFHILMNTYLSDDVKNMETRVIGDEEVTVYAPVKEKRVLTIDKHDLYEDSSGRLVYDMDGTRLFYDYAADRKLDFENDIDMDINGQRDYPTFLLPNTVYYLRMFSTRRKDSGDVNWAAKTGLGERISYISPIISFTTYPSRDLPLPLPNLTLEARLGDRPDPDTGNPVLEGISVRFPKLLDNDSWKNYTSVIENRKIVYELYISDSTDEDSFILLDSDFMEPLETVYPDQNPDSDMYGLVTRFPRGQGEAIKPNTTYYFKMQAKLYVNNEAEPFLISDETPVKSVTTPKIDSGVIDDLDRKPRTPVEFSIATDDKGNPDLTDTMVTLTWLHAEENVTYEIVCTKERLDANSDDYLQDSYHIGTKENPGFLDVYKSYKPDPEDKELHIDVVNTPLKRIGFEYPVTNTRMAKFPVNLPFLKPNCLYYFSLRAVRNRGQENAAYSDWVSIPVTTKMVASPEFLEAVNDVQIGFTLRLYTDVQPEKIKIQMKKGYQTEASYVELARSKYSVVRDNRDYYIRLYDLEPDTWYDIKPFYVSDNTTLWYDSTDKIWTDDIGDPLQMKTRDTLHEIEVRFSGETLHDYFLEIRTDDDEDYIQLQYDKDEEDSDYGYTLHDGTRVDFYREKISSYLAAGQGLKYVYYAKISYARKKKSDGTWKRQALLSNTDYYVRVWARNSKEDSSHIGPVITRTDFSQDDYDEDHKKDEISDIFESRADGLTRKLYFTVNEPDKTQNRVLLKSSTISGLLQVAGQSEVTVDISSEKPEVPRDVILIPMEIIDTLQRTNSRVTIKLSGGEVTVTGETISVDELKQAAFTAGLKEAMLEVTVERKAEGLAPALQGFELGSEVFDIRVRAVGMRRTYAEINEIIYDILKDSNATGPFKYGILERELIKLLEDKTSLTYQSQAELGNLIGLVMEEIEKELSLYIKDILDGGRGFSASEINRKDIPELPGGLKLKMIHDGFQALAEPKVLPAGKNVWQDPTGVKAWLFPYVLITCKVPGQYAVFLAPQVRIYQEGSAADPDLLRLSQKYDLKKAFAGGTLYPGDHVSKDNAVNLYELITEKTGNTAGLSTSAKIRFHGLEDILGTSALQPNVNRQQAVSLVVEIYASKTGVSVEVMRPSTYRYIKNSADIPEPIYRRLVIALDLGITSLDSDYSYKGEDPATIEELLDEVIAVLELLGEW